MKIFIKILPLMVSLAMISGCKDKRFVQENEELVPVKIRITKEQEIRKSFNYSGNIVPFKTIKFGFMVAGKIKAVHVVEGQFVNKGDPIADIDATDYQFALDAAQARYREAEKEYSRLKKLHEEASLTDSDFDKITALYYEARADYEYKKKQVNDTRLFAPATGWIAVEGIEPGEIVPQGMPLFGLVVTDRVFAEASIPEDEINHITTDMDVDVEVPAVYDSVFSGKIKRIGKVADPYSRSFPVKAIIRNKHYLLKPGMIANMKVPSGEANIAVLVPGNAILTDADGHQYVYIVKDGKARYKEILTGNTWSKEIIILKGLKQGDELVTEGQNKLYEGAPVKVVN